MAFTDVPRQRATTHRGLALKVRLGAGMNRRSSRPMWQPLESLAADLPLEAIVAFSSDQTFSSYAHAFT